MFWRFSGYTNTSTIETILDKPDVTVEELLEESDLIQELKGHNAKLIEFLRGNEVLQKLLDYVVAPKSDDESDDIASAAAADGDDDMGCKEREKKTSTFDILFGKSRIRSRSRSASKLQQSPGEEEESKEEKQRMKYAYVACEVLSCEIWSISEAVLADRQAVTQFWQYLRQPAPLDPVQASYFTKVNEGLLDRKTEEMLDVFKALPDIVPDMLQHVDCPMVMDLLLKIISLERSEVGQGIVDWLQTRNLIPILLSYLSPEHNSATQTSAGDFLKAIITISANATTQDQTIIGPNELTRQLVSEPCIQVLIKEMLRGGNPLTVGVGIVIEVIRKNNSDYDLDTQIGPVPRSSDPIYLGALLRQFSKAVPDFMFLILNPDHKTVTSDGTVVPRRKEMKSASGDTIEPLGFDRFKTCELMAELLHCSNMALLNDRGAEVGIRQRDAERDRLKAEGKLQPRCDEPEQERDREREGQEEEFGTSVDSSGFHHARAPSSLDESPEDIGRLDVQNAGEGEDEEFETVDALAEEIRGGLDDALLGGAKLDGIDEKPLPPAPPPAALDEVPPLKPRRLDDDGPTSPTSALADKAGALAIDCGDAVDEEARPEDPKTPTSPDMHESSPSQSPQRLSPHPEDKPAPLFAKKAPPPDAGDADADADTANNAPASTGSETTDITEPARSENGESARSVLANNDDDMQGPYVVDVDGSPVVGDLLKMMFVGYHVVPTILDFFFRFPWNNFLHNVVYDVVQQVFNGPMDRGYNRHLAIDLFHNIPGSTSETDAATAAPHNPATYTQTAITTRIIAGQTASDASQAKLNMRLGYMGHLTLIAEEVVKFTERHPPELIASSVLERVMEPAWVDYVERVLAETRERDNAILGGVRPDLNVGPRQAVLNAVNAAQGGAMGAEGGAGGFLNGGAGAGAGAKTGASGLPLDGLDVAAAGGYLYGAGGVGGGQSLQSGFNSSDEEEDEGEEQVVVDGGGGDGGGEKTAWVAGLTEDDQVGELSFEDVDMGY